jgi:hypothetical protein
MLEYLTSISPSLLKDNLFSLGEPCRWCLQDNKNPRSSLLIHNGKFYYFGGATSSLFREIETSSSAIALYQQFVNQESEVIVLCADLSSYVFTYGNFRCRQGRHLQFPLPHRLNGYRSLPDSFSLDSYREYTMEYEPVREEIVDVPTSKPSKLRSFLRSLFGRKGGK